MFNNHLMKACLAAVFAIGLAACSSSSDPEPVSMPDPEPTPAEMEMACTDGGGRWNADMTCTSAEELTQEQLTALQQEIADLRAQLGITDADDIGTSIGDLIDERDDLQQRIDTAKEEAEAEEMRVAAATAAKLYSGIYTPAADATGTAVGQVFAAYNDTDAPEAGTLADTLIMVTTGDDSAANTRALAQDKKAMVYDNHGWEGKRYARTSPASEGMYEAIVYSNVEEPEMGRKFGHAEPGTGDGRDFEYDLNADGALIETEADGVGGTGDAFVAGRVDSPSFDQSAGIKEFDLPTNTVAVMIAGSYHGVDGTYSCTPAADNTCATQVAALGFTLGQTLDDTNAFTAGGGEWTFTPGNSNAQVSDAVDTAYASYGWWLHKTENDLTYTASAFVDVKGTVPDAVALDNLNGTATYVGGAAGKYALTSRTGGTNDAGHFTARATLEADFTNNTDAAAISGTIDMFMGADGMSRDWSVELNGSDIGDTGGIGNAGDGTDPVMTVWTIGGTAGAEDGNWTGALRNNGDDGVPQVATGTFLSTYGTDGGEGRMIGAFGANRE